ncbi:hypothetical protein A3L11_00025 [Thermococcus siculi]|uniref:Uncharacterized protein n=1 Tax=Thermococcus siculi TaxID=72803 RepID=A0A2Z2MM28_9EURY|nr:hypothetical protein A3L11_00025 [Thermococcus siculi]
MRTYSKVLSYSDPFDVPTGYGKCWSGIIHHVCLRKTKGAVFLLGEQKQGDGIGHLIKKPRACESKRDYGAQQDINHYKSSKLHTVFPLYDGRLKMAKIRYRLIHGAV